MGITTSANLQCSISWVQLDEQSLTQIHDIGLVRTDSDIASGTGVGEANCVYHSIGTLPSGGSQKFDLMALTRELFDDTALVAFNNIKGLIFRNTSEVQGQHIAIAATGTDGFIDPFNGGSGNFPIHPTMSFCAGHPFEGWAIASGNRNIYLMDTAGFGVSYEISIFGVSG